MAYNHPKGLCWVNHKNFPESGQFDVIGSGCFQIQGLEFLQSFDLTFTQIHGIFKSQIPSFLSALF